MQLSQNWLATTKRVLRILFIIHAISDHLHFFLIHLEQNFILFESFKKTHQYKQNIRDLSLDLDLLNAISQVICVSGDMFYPINFKL